MDSAAVTPVPEVQDAPDRSLYVLGPAHSPGEVPIAVPDADGVVTIAPRSSTQWRLALVGGIPLLIVLVSQGLIYNSAGFWVFPVVALPLFLLTTWATVVRARVVVTPERVGMRGLFGYRWVDRASLSRLLVARGYGRGTDAFVFDSTGKVVVRLSGQVWDEPRIQALHAALGLPTRVRQGPTSRADLRREEPRALAWPEAHPVAFISITFAGTTLVLVGLLYFALNIGIMILTNSLIG